MEELHYFKQKSDPQIHAALIGINKMDWVHATHQHSIEEIAAIMLENGFDVLPQKNKGGDYLQYYTTVKWGEYSKENLRWDKIDMSHSIYYLTSLRDVFKQFHSKGQNYFFLSNHSEAIGLVTIGNLNCKHVYLYFYNLINQLEDKLARLLISEISRDEILELLKTYANSVNIKSISNNTLQRFNNDCITGVDADILEYMYLSEIFQIYLDKKLFKKLGYSNENKFCLNNSRIKEIRNIVSHPNKSLIKDLTSVDTVWTALLKIEDLISRIDEVMK